MDEIISQAPANLSNEEIEKIFIKNNSNVNNTLTELWDISFTNITEKEPTKWDEIRDICDSYDKEMKNIVHKYRT
jgi:hypothetical protein